MLKSWRDMISERFVPLLHKLYLVVDRDGLLSDEKLIHTLQQKGFQFIEAREPMQLRYDYELVRQKEDRGESSWDLVILCNPERFEEQSLPYDIQTSCHRVSLSLFDLFPNLYSPSVKQLEKQVYDTLLIAIEDESIDSPMNGRQTNLFLLRSLYRIHGNELQTDVDLFKLFLRIHYMRKRVPLFLSSFLENYVFMKHTGLGWSIETLLNEPQTFWSYVQSIWEAQVRGEVQYSSVGPGKLPFSHTDILVYLDNAFREGFLHPVRIACDKIKGDLPKSLLEVGTTQGTEEEIQRERLEELLELLPIRLPSENALFNEWLEFQPQYAQLLLLSVSITLDTAIQAKVDAFVSTCSMRFSQWLLEHFDALVFEQAKYPVLVSQIISYMHGQTASSEKIALIVLDGMSYSQWLTIRSFLERDLPAVSYEESGCFAWIPSLTSVSRQAIFAGTLPRYFGASINTTSTEGNLWANAWKKENPYCDKTQIIYMKGLGMGDVNDAIYQLTPSILYAGIVINAVDEIMHGMMLGEQGMQKSVALWMKKRYLANLIKGLHDKGYSIWLTSDHGNIEAKGVGRIQEGSLAETKGQRVRTYTSQVLRDATAIDHQDISEPWDSTTLPEGYYPLLAKNRGAFVNKDDSVVSHGGASLEEVIVPFVRVIRKKNEQET